MSDDDDLPSEPPRVRAVTRREGPAAPRGVVLNRTPKYVLDVLRAPFPGDAELLARRPRTRADCASVPRPCPWAGCRANTFLDVQPRTGSLKLNWGELEPGDVPAATSCALDVADAGGLTLEGVAEIQGVTRERVRQEQEAALAKMRRNALAAGLDLGEVLRGFAHPRGDGHGPVEDD